MMGELSGYCWQELKELWHGEQELSGDMIQTQFNGGLVCLCVFAWFGDFVNMKDPFIWTLCYILSLWTYFSVEIASDSWQGRTSKALSSCEALWINMHQQQLCHLILLTFLRQDCRKPKKPEILFIPIHKIKFGGDSWLVLLYHQIPEWALVIYYTSLPVISYLCFLKPSMLSKSWLASGGKKP